MKNPVMLVALVAALFVSSAQAESSQSLWADVDAPGLSASAERTVEPIRFRSLSLDLSAMSDRLERASAQGAEVRGSDRELLLSLPHPDGHFVDFRVQRSGLLSPGLAKRYPEIRTYRGVAVDGSGQRVWLDVTPQGFHAMVRGHDGSWFIDPYWRDRSDVYVSYWREDLPRPLDLPNLQPPEGEPLSVEVIERFAGQRARGDELRTYRLAMAATGEYTQFHGGTVPLALAAIVTTMNRVSGIYEDELSVSFTLIANTDDVIYTNGATDPYTNNNGSTMLGENQANLDAVIGSANYDIGHVFSTGGGGIARLRSVCGTGIKARGVTGLGSPVGDPFDVDYVAHEIGHQFGGNHTFNNCSGSVGPIPYEPFSGSTIMAYAGICSTNLQSNSDAHFHTGNFDEISAFLLAGGASCGTVDSLDNQAPTVDAGTGGFTIPAETPFMLTGSATDPDGNGLRYRWEQHDLTSDNGPPLFRSFPATAEPVRLFPRLNDLLNNTTSVGETLPTSSRTMSFRLTALDDHAGGGGVDYDEVVFDVDGGSGPFLVTAPNTAVIWAGGASETVTWNVAGTDQAPVSCAAVDIDLSTDGGQNFDLSLASSTPNDGSETITVPGMVTSQARLRVRCSDNIFFDLSNTDFTIEVGNDDFSVVVSPATLEACVGQTAAVDVAVGQIGAFAETVSLAALGHGGSAAFSQNDQAPPFTSELELGGLVEGVFDVTVTGTASSGTRQDNLALTVLAPPATAPDLLGPADGASIDAVTVLLEWAAVSGVDQYLVEVDEQSDFASPVLSQTVTGTSLQVPEGLLQGSTDYFWRVSSQNGCGLQAGAPRQFTTSAISCQTVASTDLPKAISASGTPTVSSVLDFAAGGTIVDVDLVGLGITHSYVQDLTVTLSNPAGSSVVLLDQTCGSQNNVAIGFDDESELSPLSWPCPPTDGLSYQPENPLSALDGQDSNGIWTLTIDDGANQDGGSLDAWSLRVCIIQTPQEPLIFQDRFEP
ncbi:reprolysin-like metallopeptidase [Wenzhouxiangella marina]|uniref:Proprotein convertase P n=1 Tax=Wenzhouxiangella marina TaxID=1579979 RepID=A0A0K0XZT9_9GAMM|nr:zinc-dependent metalloprotease family protein [Wenzhouxiangella marina]AKS43190.1 Proprotein convertase P [Wenzhouxiangella marina]MBB6087124.1 subtilisin-like proprotein convertase family protein [Wenzhouxiangella marina]